MWECLPEVIRVIHKQSTAKIAKTAIIITKISKNYSQFHCNNPWHSTEMTADT